MGFWSVHKSDTTSQRGGEKTSCKLGLRDLKRKAAPGRPQKLKKEVKNVGRGTKNKVVMNHKAQRGKKDDYRGVRRGVREKPFYQTTKNRRTMNSPGHKKIRQESCSQKKTCSGEWWDDVSTRSRTLNRQLGEGESFKNSSTRRSQLPFK